MITMPNPKGMVSITKVVPEELKGKYPPKEIFRQLGHLFVELVGAVPKTKALELKDRYPLGWALADECT
jgi:hypothetical protein